MAKSNKLKNKKLGQNAELVALEISIKSLLCLYSTTDPNGVTNMLIKRKSELENFFRSDFNYNELIDTLQLLVNVYNLTNELASYRSKILSTTHCEEFLDCIKNYLLGVKKNPRNRAELLDAIKLIVWFLDVNVNELPLSKVHYERFGELLQVLLVTLNNSGFHKEKMFFWACDLKSLVEKKLTFINRINLTWRDMNIYPNSIDIFENKIFIPNKLGESYSDVKEYLNIHFQLLKEDFESNLRDGLRQFKAKLRGSYSKDISDLYVYNQVKVESLESDKNPRNGLIHKIFFKLGDKEESNDTSKSFMNGSLLLFSEFSQFSTFILATVVEEIDLPESKKNWSRVLKVSVVGDPSWLVVGHRYTMVEPKTFFEPYYQVLKAIQDLEPQNFPMVKYIVYSDINPSWPKYINANTEYLINGTKLKLFSKGKWPDNVLKMNGQQLEALHAALIHDFVMIQGPPGSGKTYLTENIIRVLIENKNFLSTPILLISSKNNTVDRILEPLAVSGRKVVRLGGQSKSSVLKKCTIFNVIKRIGGKELKEKINIMKEDIVRKIHVNEKVEEEIKKFRNEQRSFMEYCDRENAKQLLFANVEIIGGTTAGCARMKFMLDNLQPEVIIVEDANEVLESHVVASLSKGCKHVILIGDKQQLRPSVTSKCSEDYNLDVSLLERMARCGVKCCFLTEQRRMRPEIASLLCPSIYSSMLNHPGVINSPDIKGLAKNLFFIDHEVQEEKIDDSQVHQGYYNKHEGDLLLALAGYLLKQGYSTSDITILSPYRAQQNYMRQAAKSFPSLQDVEIQMIDNYSGQENMIILLSFVRSNSSMIGFLASNNRINVALSRAKCGLYIIGNMKTLVNGSPLMSLINEVLKKQNAIGKCIELKCQTHQTKTTITNENDFENVSNGGCRLPCKMKLRCGHLCKLTCHPVREIHQKYICKEPCTKLCARSLHRCSKQCYENCGFCTKLVEKVLPCGHRNMIPCSESDFTLICMQSTEVEFLCFFRTVVPCHMADTCCYSRVD